MRYVYVTGYLALAAVIQLFIGNFPLPFMAFPLNVVFAVIWLFLLWNLYQESRNLSFTRFLLAPQTSILSILLLIAGSLVIGLFPQLSEVEAEARKGLFSSLGCYNFMAGFYIRPEKLLIFRIKFVRKGVAVYYPDTFPAHSNLS